MGIVLGVDSGGTKASYVLADGTRELARTRSGSIKRMRVDAELAESNLTAALEELERQSGLALRQVGHTCIGTAGNTVPLVTDWLRKQFGRRVGGSLEVCGDVEIALDAAFHGGAGVLVLAGTGSNVVGRTRGGELTSAGGYGPVLADQGSGQRIGLMALRETFLAQDEGRETALQEAVLRHWSLADLNEVVSYVHSTLPPDLAALTEVVLRVAEAGDDAAGAVLAREGEDLAHLAVLVMRRLMQADCRSGQAEITIPAVAFAGSIMEHVQPVRGALVRALHRELPGCQALDGVVDPLLGALWRARQAVS